MAPVDWSECPLVEVIPGRVSGAPLLKNTRLPVEAITELRRLPRRGPFSEAAIAETLDCYPEISVEAIKVLLDYRASHQLQTHP